MKLLTSLLLLISVHVSAQTPRLSDEAVIFHTDYGDMAAVFYPDEAPRHTEQILKLVRNGVYTHTLFFRTEKGFVTQVENFNMRAVPLNDDQLKLVEKIPAEFNSIHHRRGILSMARMDDPNSAETSFSFVLGEAPHLDRNYTVFGEIIQNIGVLDEIENLPPKTVYITSAEIVDRKNLPSIKLAAGPSPLSNSAVQITLLSILAMVAIVIFKKITSKN